jgi:hypothetical protein
VSGPAAPRPIVGFEKLKTGLQSCASRFLALVRSPLPLYDRPPCSNRPEWVPSRSTQLRFYLSNPTQLSLLQHHHERTLPCSRRPCHAPLDDTCTPPLSRQCETRGYDNYRGEGALPISHCVTKRILKQRQTVHGTRNRLGPRPQRPGQIRRRRRTLTSARDAQVSRRQG